MPSFAVGADPDVVLEPLQQAAEDFETLEVNMASYIWWLDNPTVDGQFPKQEM